jgi:hypothetical protein
MSSAFSKTTGALAALLLSVTFTATVLEFFSGAWQTR